MKEKATKFEALQVKYLKLEEVRYQWYFDLKARQGFLHAYVWGLFHKDVKAEATWTDLCGYDIALFSTESPTKIDNEALVLSVLY